MTIASGLARSDMLEPQAVEPEVFARGKRRFVLPLELHAQHHDDIGVADRGLECRVPASRRARSRASSRGSSGAGPQSTMSAPNFESR